MNDRHLLIFVSFLVLRAGIPALPPRRTRPQVKSLKTPPKGVKLTMEVCCIMFDVKPIKVKDPDSGKKV